MTSPGTPPQDPGPRRQPGSARDPVPQPDDIDLRELHDPYFDLMYPDYSDFLPPRLPLNAILIDQVRGWQPDLSLAELLESIRTRDHQLEPDPEAEP